MEIGEPRRCGSHLRGATDVPMNPVARFLQLSLRFCERNQRFRQEPRMPRALRRRL